MLKGLSVYETYSGPPVGAIEFCLHDGNFRTRKALASELRKSATVLSAHLPSFMPVDRLLAETEFDDGTVDHFVAHVTERSKPGGLMGVAWRHAWKDFAHLGKRVLFENHNQDWHPTDAGLCWPEEFCRIADAGHRLCLDVGHILYANSARAGGDVARWHDMSEVTFEGFLKLPIAQVHVHTVGHLGGHDHRLEGFDVGPWLKRIVARNPGVALLVEVMDPAYTEADRTSALDRWLA